MSENSMSDGKNIQRLPVVSVGLRRLLTVVFLLFALLAVNSTYLASITLLEHFTAQTHQDYFYLTMFLAHLVLGLALVVPFLAQPQCGEGGPGAVRSGVAAAVVRRPVDPLRVF